MTAGPVGRVARVLVALRGADRPGEVELVLDGVLQTWIAYSDEELARGATVLVVAERGARSVDVVPWHQHWHPHWDPDQPVHQHGHPGPHLPSSGAVGARGPRS